MKITFKHVDKEYYGVAEYVTPVAESALLSERFVPILCEILNTYDSYSEKIFNDVNQTLKLSKYKISDMGEKVKQDYEQFSKSVSDFYWNIVDNEFGRQAKIFDEDLYYKEDLRYPDKRLQRYRGILLEELVCTAVRSRYKGRMFASGCKIYIDWQCIIARYGDGNAKHKETIDVAGWMKKLRFGEFYECKVNPKRFEEPNYMYFSEINKALDANEKVRYRLALVSADARINLEKQKAYIEQNPNLKCSARFELIGREDIFQLLNYKIPEIA